jgi:hypothetical protein
MVPVCQHSRCWTARIGEYRHRLARLRLEIDDLESTNEHERAARVRAELNWLTAELTRAAGFGERTRGFPDDGERARIVGGKAIRRALLGVTEVDALIGEHLRRTVHTGNRRFYQPG